MIPKFFLYLLYYTLIAKFVHTDVPMDFPENAQLGFNDPVTVDLPDISNEILNRYNEFLSRIPNTKKFSSSYLSELAKQCVADTPTYVDFFSKAYIAFNEFCFNPDQYAYSLDIYWLALQSIKLRLFLIPILFAIVISLLRLGITNLFLKTRYGLELDTDKNRRKATTSLWNFIGYTCLLCADSFVVLQMNYIDFQYPLCIFNSIRLIPGYFEIPVPPGYYYLYMLQLGFYIHSIYAVIVLDVRRKDTYISIVHHVITIFLLGFSLVSRFYKIGAMILLLHDISDIFLELGKFTVALRNHSPRRRAVCEVIANILFAFFTISWFFLRMYWFPLKILHATTWGVYITHVGREAYFFLFFNSMLWLLFAIHIYWSYFIVKMLLRIVVGKMPRLEDSRELDCDSPPTPVPRTKSEGKNHNNSRSKKTK